MEGRQTWRYVEDQDTPDRKQTMLEAHSLGLDTVGLESFFIYLFLFQMAKQMLGLWLLLIHYFLHSTLGWIDCVIVSGQFEQQYKTDKIEVYKENKVCE